MLRYFQKIFHLPEVINTFWKPCGVGAINIAPKLRCVWDNAKSNSAVLETPRSQLLHFGVNSYTKRAFTVGNKHYLPKLPHLLACFLLFTLFSRIKKISLCDVSNTAGSNSAGVSNTAEFWDNVLGPDSAESRTLGSPTLLCIIHRGVFEKCS